MKRFLKLSALVLAVALVGAFVLNLSKPFKQITQKKVVNPENLLLSEDVVWADYIVKDGLTYERNEDGSWHIYGTSTQSTGVSLCVEPFVLESGKTYSLSSGMKNAGVYSYFLVLNEHDGPYYVGDIEPISSALDSNYVYGPFEGKGCYYYLKFVVRYAGAVIDEVLYPCLVEGTEPGDFYIYK